MERLLNVIIDLHIRRAVVFIVVLHINMFVELLRVTLNWFDVIVITILLTSIIIGGVALPAPVFGYYLRRQGVVAMLAFVLCVWKHYAEQL